MAMTEQKTHTHQCRNITFVTIRSQSKNNDFNYIFDIL